MEIEEHIVEEYFRRKGYLTNSNIRLGGNREIDILAMDHLKKDFLHIEVSVRLGYDFQLEDKTHMFDIINYPKKKFDDQIIQDYVIKQFGTKDYKKVVVIWDKPKKYWEEIKSEAKKKGITILLLKDILKGLLEDLKRDTKNQRDSVIRTIQLISRIR